MKKLIVLYVILSLGCTGCFPEMAQIKPLAEDVILLSSKVDAYQAVIDDVVDLLEADNLIDEKIVAKVDKANEEIDRIQPQIVDVAEAIKDVDGNIIDVAKAGVAATAPWNPYATMIIVGLTLLEGITALFLKKKNNEAIASDKKYAAHKQGTELFSRNHPDSSAEIYENIGNARRGLLKA